MCILMEQFYNGLNQASKMLANASANGSLLKKKKKEEVNEANEIMDTIANNKLNWGHAEA